MPLPVPAGDLPVAYRVKCVRCVRRMIREDSHLCVFLSNTSSKCEYCSTQKSNCVPLPWFVDTEYDALVAAIESGQGRAISAAAANLDEVLRVAAASAPKTREDAIMGLLEETRALRAVVTTGVHDLSVLSDKVTKLVQGLESAEKSKEAASDANAVNATHANASVKRARAKSNTGPCFKRPRRKFSLYLDSEDDDDEE